jgi:hypothetical protein
MADGNPDTVTTLAAGALVAAIGFLGKEAARAVTTLTNQGLGVSAAFFDGKAREVAAVSSGKVRMIEVENEASAALTLALAEKARQMAVNDPAIVERSLDRWAGDIIVKQLRREANAWMVIEDLREQPSQSEERVSDDFLNRYAAEVESIGEEAVQRLFSKLLAGEIRQPGRYSLRVIHLLSLLDRKAAEAIAYVAPRMVGDHVPFQRQNNDAILALAVADLHELGFFISDIHDAREWHPFMPNGGTVWLAMRPVTGAPALGLTASHGRPQLYSVQATRAGMSIISMVEPKYTPAIIRGVAETLFNCEEITSVEQGVVDKRGITYVEDKTPFDPPLRR